MISSQSKATHADRRVSGLDRRRVVRGGRREADQIARRQAVASTLLNLRASKAGRAPRILVVDDYRDGRELMVEYLRFCGFQVEDARTGAQAIDKTTVLQPDIVLLDLVLPDIRGLDIITRLQQSEMTGKIKIVVFTAQVLDDIRARVAAAGVEMFIPKPCDLEVVALQLAYLAARKGESDTKTATT